jgi:hypothetical protein
MKLVFSLLLVIACSLSGHAQLYFHTRDVIKNTKYVRKKQAAHSIQGAFVENNDLIISFTGTLHKKSKRKPYHIRLAIDSVLSYYRDKPSFTYVFDSATRDQYNVQMIETRYGDLPGGRAGHTVEILCIQEIIDSGFYAPTTVSTNVNTVEIIDGRNELYTHNHQSRIYLHGKHIVFLYKLPQPFKTERGEVTYVVINIENSPRINKWNYMKLPYTFVLDTAILPFVLLMSGMEK